MKKMGCFPAALFAGVSLWLFAYVYMSLWPAEETIVNLPTDHAIARFQEWGGFLRTQPFVLRVDTPHGTLSTELWADWGPASTINLYWTPENWLVGIGGGGYTVIIDVVDKSGPRIIIGNEQDKTHDQDWRFLGYAGRIFIPAADQPECIALLGAGYSPYRKRYQVPHSC